MLSEKAYTRLRQEKDRPKTATLKEAQQHILPHLETTFRKFWEVSQGHEGRSCAFFWVGPMLLKSEVKCEMPRHPLTNMCSILFTLANLIPVRFVRSESM